MSIVRENMLKERGYVPYCGGQHCTRMPRAPFDGSQFRCPACGWRSAFEPEFIEQYKAAQAAMSTQEAPDHG